MKSRVVTVKEKPARDYYLDTSSLESAGTGNASTILSARLCAAARLDCDLPIRQRDGMNASGKRKSEIVNRAKSVGLREDVTISKN
jgi:hypothetical protein